MLSKRFFYYEIFFVKIIKFCNETNTINGFRGNKSYK